MAVVVNTYIVPEGLIYSLDAANFKSYPGSGTTFNGLFSSTGGTLVNGTGYTSDGGGSFVFFGTSQMESGQIDRAAYAISKGGLKTLSEHLARRYAQFKIRSNIVVMGWTPTEGEIELRSSLGVSKEDLISKASDYIPMGRMLTVNDPVPTVLHFLSDDSSMITGSEVRITGGEFI